jgi:hypothetical protein
VVVWSVMRPVRGGTATWAQVICAKPRSNAATSAFAAFIAFTARYAAARLGA